MSNTHPGHILHRINPELHTSEAVQSYVDHHEQRTGEVLGNAEEKLGRFIMYVETALEQDDERFLESVYDSLVIAEDNIPDSFWIREVAINNGDPVDKKQVIREVQSAQEDSIKAWVDILQDSRYQIPTWFKIYVVKGLATMGSFNIEKGEYGRRSRTMTDPYPTPSLYTIGDVLSKINAYDHDADRLRANNPIVTKLIENGNFRKLYSHLFLEQNPLITTPESPDDVVGEWKEYGPGDSDAAMQAARTTTWCISASRPRAVMYTERPGSKLQMFHLKDKQSGTVSPDASAAILFRNGMVSSVHGRKGGGDQQLEYALMPQVAERLRVLSGGEPLVRILQNVQRAIDIVDTFDHGQTVPKSDLTWINTVTSADLKYNDEGGPDRVYYRVRQLQDLSIS